MSEHVVAEAAARPADTGPARRRIDALFMAAGIGLAAALTGWADGTLVCGVLASLWWIAVVVIVRSDLDRFIIPDQASLAVAALGFVEAALSAPMADFGAGAVGTALAAAALTGAAAFCLFWAVQHTYRRVSGREGLGFGDVKLAGASAVWLSVPDAGVALEVAALAALALLLWRRRDGPVRDIAVPFGAFIAPAAWLAFLCGPILHPLLDRLG